LSVGRSSKLLLGKICLSEITARNMLAPPLVIPPFFFVVVAQPLVMFLAYFAPSRNAPRFHLQNDQPIKSTMQE
jgi:hypothetical protein